MRKQWKQTVSLTGVVLSAAILAFPALAATNLYRVATSGAWDDSQWYDSNSDPYVQPSADDDVWIAVQSSDDIRYKLPGAPLESVLTATVTLDSVGAVVSNLWLARNDSTQNGSDPSGNLILTNGATLTIGGDFLVAHGVRGNALADVRMEPGTSIDVGRNLDIYTDDVTLRGDGLTIGNDILIAYQTSGLSSADPTELTISGGTATVPGQVYIGFNEGGHGRLILTNNATLIVSNNFTLGATDNNEANGELFSDSGSTLVVGGDFKCLCNRSLTSRIENATVVVSNRFLLGVKNEPAHYRLTKGTSITAGDFLIYKSKGDGITRANRLWIEGGSSLNVRRPASGEVTCYLHGMDARANTYSYLYLGDTNGPGTIGLEDTGGSGSVNLIIRDNHYGGDLDQPYEMHAAVLQGWGKVELNGTLQNYGDVIADGYGTDRELVITNFAEIIQNENWGVDSWVMADHNGTNLHHAGWYAVNGGKLLLPPIKGINPGETVRWGDTRGDVLMGGDDLANSVMLACDADVTGGDVSIALLATNRTDAHVATNTVIGVWKIDGADFDFGASGTVTLSFRYDNWLAKDKGLTEGDLKIWQYDGRKWQDQTAAIDTDEDFITTQALTSFSLFAVSTEKPAPDPPPTGTLIMFR